TRAACPKRTTSSSSPRCEPRWTPRIGTLIADSNTATSVFEPAKRVPATPKDRAVPSFVVATAGHVAHGKSALVQAVTGTAPDRWAEEHRRGLTVDLGFAWFHLHDGAANVAFVDVPGHERFLGNMLSGLGPAPVVCFVVAADEGWQAQSDDHRDAIAALGIAR